MSDLLFYGADWFSVERNEKEKLKRLIQQYPEKDLLQTPEDELINYFCDEGQLHVPSIIESEISVDIREESIEVHDQFRRYGRGDSIRVPGTTVEVFVPFDGDQGFFKIQPTTHNMNPPRATVERNQLRFAFSRREISSEQIQAEVERFKSSIEQYLGWHRSTVHKYNTNLGNFVKPVFEERKQRLLKSANTVASLPYKIKKRNTPSTYSTPMQRTRIKPSRPQPLEVKAARPEPTLPQAVYDDILRVLENMTDVIERSPGVFATTDEETIRSHFLVQLNGTYEREGSAETFNHSGKTDIFLRDGDKNVFYAECKIWTGKKAISDALDQLLSYASWRDSKTALMIFSRRRNFSEVLAKLHDAMTTH